MSVPPEARTARQTVRRHALFTTQARAHSPLLCPSSHKISFPSAHAALKYRDESDRLGRNPLPLKAYKCDECPHFHLTTSSNQREPQVHVRAFWDLTKAAATLREALADPGQCDADQVRGLSEDVISADRRVRTMTECDPGVDNFRATYAERLRVYISGGGRWWGYAKKVLDELAPLAICAETWGWVSTQRERLIFAIDTATSEGRTHLLADATEAHVTALNAHIKATGVNAQDVYSSEFVLVSEITADAVESSTHARATELAVEVLLFLEVAPQPIREKEPA